MNHTPRIIMVNNERESYSRRTVQWEGGDIRFTSVGFEHVVTGGLGGADAMRIDRPALEKLVSQTRAADVIYCESPEALLLWYVYLRRGLPLPPFVIEDEDVLFRVTALARWLHDRTACCVRMFTERDLCRPIWKWNRHYSSEELFPVFLNKNEIIWKILNENSSEILPPSSQKGNIQ